MHITLLRHGKPAFQLSGLVRAEALPQIVDAYAVSGIIDEPPRDTKTLAQGHDLVISSDLPRAVESAHALGIKHIHHKDPLFRETPIPHFSSGRMTLPIGIWVVVLRILWLFGFSRNGESFTNARRRARQAAERLAQLANEHGNIILVGHGFINHFIAKELKTMGWLGPGSSSKGSRSRSTLISMRRYTLNQHNYCIDCETRPLSTTRSLRRPGQHRDLAERC